MKQRKITYINISEDRTYYSHMTYAPAIELRHSVCIQETTEGKKKMRNYRCSHWSVKRMAMIQDKLAG